MSGQSPRRSAVEAVLNVAFGYLVAVATQAVVLPWFGVRISPSDNMAIAAIFTVVSLARSYALRRLFNRWEARGAA